MLQRVLAFLVLFFGGLVLAQPAWGAPGVSVTMISSPALTLDSNKPCQEGPQAAYVAFRVTNTSGAPLSNVRVTLGGFANGITLGGTLSGTPQAASQYVGNMDAGAQRVLYWYIEYACNTVGATANLVVSVTDATPGATTGNATVTTTSMVSAQAGGTLMSGTMGAGAVVGQIIPFDVAYEFGGASAGDSHNLQVAGNRNFNAGCFQLVRMEVVSTSVVGSFAGQMDTPFFTAPVGAGGSKIPMTVRYFFKYLCANTITTAKPYANQNSGGQLKYSSNYETFVGPSHPSATNPFVVTKTVVDSTLAAGGTVTYSVTVSNPSPYTAELDSVVDVLPAGVTFGTIAAGSGATALNSGSTPAGGSTGRTVWRGIPLTSYVLPAGGAFTIRYTATVVNTPGQYTNTAQARTGLTQLGQTASATVTVGTADLVVTKTTTTPSVVASDTIRYTVSVTNNGPNPAFGVVVRDTLPANVTFISATGAPVVSGRVLTWPTTASLANGASLSYSIVVRAPHTVTSVTNVATGSSRTFDPAPGNSSGSATTVVSSSVVVTPDGLAAPLARLPNGTGYTQEYVVRNASTVPGDYRLALRAEPVGAAGVFLSVDSVKGHGITSAAAYATTQVPLAARTSYTYTVFYRVATGDTAVNHEFLRAQALADTTLRDDGWVPIRRVYPRLTLTKTVSPTGLVAQGTDLTYTMRMTNVGEYAASAVTLTDSIPIQVAFKIGTVSQTLPAGLAASVSYLDAAGNPIAPGGAGCVAPAGYDVCVRRIRWTLSGELPAGASASDGTFTFVARIK